MSDSPATTSATFPHASDLSPTSLEKVEDLDEGPPPLSKARRIGLLSIVRTQARSLIRFIHGIHFLIVLMLTETNQLHPLQFCCAQFVDVYNASAVVLATAPIAQDLNMGAGESVWTLSAYVLVFASFMLPVSPLRVVPFKWMIVLPSRSGC